MEVKKGYKQTEVGIIPEDWEVNNLEHFWSVIDCKHVTADFVANGVPIASIREVQSRFVNLDNAKHTTEFYYSKLTEGGRQPLPGNLIFSRNATVGEVAQVAEWHPRFVIGQDVCLLIKKSPEYSSDYLQEVIRSQIVADQLENLMVGSTFKRVNVEQIKGLKVPMPKADEQRAIAVALSDVDALLTALDALIAKKRNIKQGAMQELLTGKRRLPGFSGEWEVKRLGEVAEIKTGKKNNEDKVEDGIYPFFVRSQTVERINTYSFDGEAILIPGEGGIGSIFHYINGKFDYHQRVYKISDFRDEVCGKFIYFYISQNFGVQAMRNTVKATVDSLRLPTFQEFEFLSPPFDEQRAIAEILSEMDAEIAGLEQRCEKTRLLKQGMMQELLTGRVRLV